MTERSAESRFSCSARTYRWLDRASKLGGVALIALGLEAGGGTPTGVALAALGAACGLLTVLIDTQ